MSEDITKNEVVSDAIETDNISQEKTTGFVSETQEQEKEAGEKTSVETGEAGETVEAATEEIQASEENAGGAKIGLSKRMKIILGSAAVVVVLILTALLLPNMLTSVDDLCARGEYLKAYAKASDEEKLQVKAESIAAERCVFAVDHLKNPDSFKLRDVYYNEQNGGSSTPAGQLVLYISGMNSFGGSVGNYWLFAWDNDDREWAYMCSVSSLEDEEYKSYDDSEDILEKLANNIGRMSIKSTMEKGIKLDKEAVGRINAMFEAGTLDSVVPVEMMDRAST